MDITDQILRYHETYGSSDFTAQLATSSSKSLNYANAASIQKPETRRVTTIPRVLKYEDSIGLFGSENYFVRIDLNIQNPVSACYEEPGWECARTSNERVNLDDPYTFANTGGDTPGQAYIDTKLDLETENTYEPAMFVGNTALLSNALVKVDLRNLKTGNQYDDCWIDVRLYDKERNEHPYEIMYVRPNSFFYIGVHARNTRRIPYNIACAIGVSAPGTGDGLTTLFDLEDERFLAAS